MQIKIFRYPTVQPWDGKTDLPQEVLSRKFLTQKEQPVRGNYPGYKKGTKSFAGDCGLPGPSERIVGGDEATPHQYPWMAALFIDDKYFCGGTLISDEWVMTAGHCADGAQFMNIMLGAHNVREDVEDGRLEIHSEEIMKHESYNPFLIHNDIALVHLPEPIEFNGKEYYKYKKTTFGLNFQITCDQSACQPTLSGTPPGSTWICRSVVGESQQILQTASAPF